ncbi:MAG TPA: alpha/beta fold hydrolase [Chloroflexota bacterium]|nr:alpha/beta fold hydrolase [Chloroflexota bacterium]
MALKVLFDDAEYDGQLLRALAYTYHGGADIGECLTTARRISAGDDASWYREWCATADRVVAAAEASRTTGHHVSAREAYLRASNYYRTAFIFLYRAPVDPRAVAALAKHRAAFRQAAALFTPPAEPVAIPYENTTLPGYFFAADARATPRATLLVTGGYDGTAEESYFSVAGALRRGYNALCFDGPGQGAVLWEQRLPMRPDWERVVTPVVDYALTRPEVDAQRLVLLGRSWGGYLAPRAATAEHRLAACIADPGLLSPADGVRRQLPPDLLRQLEAGDLAAVNAALDHLPQTSMLRFTLRRGVLVHGVDSPAAYLQSALAYTLRAQAGQIRCPILICQAENDLRASQSQELYDALTCPKRLLAFTDAEGAGEHCEAGAAALFDQRVWDWLDETLAARPASAGAPPKPSATG